MKKLLMLLAVALGVGSLFADYQFTDDKGQTWILSECYTDEPVAGSGEYINPWWIKGVKPAPEGTFEIPARLAGRAVYGIINETFKEQNGITNLVIATGIREIGVCAFKGCTNLVSVTIGDDVDCIDTEAFAGCEKLAAVKIGDYLGLIKADAFDGTKFLENAEAEHQALVLGGHLYTYFSTNETYAVPAEVKIIDDYAFSATPTNSEGKACLKKITFNDGLETIGENAFYTENGYFEFDEVVIPDSVTEVGGNAFESCVAKSLKIGNGVTDIDWMWSSFRSVECPEPAPEDIEAPICPDGTNDFATAVTLTNAFGKSAGYYAGDGSNTWWHWTAPFDGVAAFSTFGSGFDTKMWAYTGTSEDDLTEIDFNDDGDGDGYLDCESKVVFLVKKGVTYHIGVKGYYEGIPHDIVLRWTSEKFTLMKSITFGDGITDIPDYMFPGSVWPLLESVTFGAGLETIGYEAFDYCPELSSVDFSRAVKLQEIGAEAFRWCAFKSLDLSACTSLWRIGSEAFYGCSSLESITFNEGLVEIGSEAFETCTKLKTLTFPSTLCSIGDNAFLGCLALSEINLNDGLQTIGGSAFARGWYYGYNEALTEIDIPSSVESLGYGLFEGCTNLTAITGCEGVTYASDPFGGDVPAAKQWYCGEFDENTGTQLTFKVVILGKTVLGFQGACPEKLEAKDFGKAEVIGGYAFAYCDEWDNTYNLSVSNLTSVTFADSVQEIGPDAFVGAYNLTELKFAGDTSKVAFGYQSFRQTGLKELKGVFQCVDQEAFANCPDLKDVDVKLAMLLEKDEDGWYLSIDPYLGESAFASCTNLDNAVVNMIGTATNEEGEVWLSNPYVYSRIFEDCTALTNVELLADSASISVYNESDSRFAGCTNLTSATIDLGKGQVGGRYLFAGCDALRTVSFNAANVPSYMFKDMVNLESCLIGDDVGTIGESAFGGCTGLTEFAILDGVTEVGDSAFAGCSGLTNLTGCAGILRVGESAFSETALFGDQTNGAFVVNGILAGYIDVPGVTKAVIPEGVRVVAEGSFVWCDITEIEFPATVEYIPCWTAYNCFDLETVVCKNPDTLFAENPESDSNWLFGDVVEVIVKKIGQRAYGFEWTEDEVYGDCYIAAFEELRFHNDESEDGPFVGNTSYVGWLMEKGSGQVVGSITVTSSALKDGQSKVTAKIQMAGWKKSYTATFEVDEKTGKAFIADPESIVNGYGANPLNGMFLGGNWLSGQIAFDGRDYDVRGGNAKKDVDSFDDFANRVWAAAFTADIDDGRLDLATAKGYSTMTFTVGKKGKIKVAGVLSDGTKVSSTAQMVAGDNGVIAAPVSVGLYTGKKGGFSCLLKFFTDESGASSMTLTEDEGNSAKYIDGTLSTWTLPYTYANKRVWTSVPLYVESVGEIDTVDGLKGSRYGLWINDNEWFANDNSCYNEMLRRACKGFSPYFCGVGGAIDPKSGKLQVAKADKWSILAEKQATTTYAADIERFLAREDGVSQLEWCLASDGKYLMPYEGDYDDNGRFVPTDWFLIDEGIKIDKTTGDAIYPEFYNECNTKVTYNKKTGQFSGSSVYYWVDETKAEKHALKTGKFTLGGVVIDGAFYGAAVAKGIESFMIDGGAYMEDDED